MKKLVFLTLLALVTPPLLGGQIPSISELSLDEKIGQLITIATVSSSERNRAFMKGSAYQLDPLYVEKMIKKYHIGGVIFMGAGVPEEQYKITTYFQSISRYPLLVGLDAEWGLSMRLHRGVVTFPRAMTLGAFSPEDDYLIYELGKEIGRQCKLLGVHINFAPVADVNNNPYNPVINTRSFGESPEKVSRKAALYMKGLTDAGILACGKHVPGHGDTSLDTHHGHCVISHSQERLRQVELTPFKHLIDEGIPALMTAHIDVPALSKEESIPATLSYTILTQLLRNEFGFEGLIITDGLGMKGITDDFNPGDLEVKALKAGNDMLLCPVDVPKAIESIKQAVHNGHIDEKEIDSKVERILQAKRIVISKTPQFEKADLCTPYAQELKKKLYRAAITIARDSKNRLPLKKQKKPLTLITFGKNTAPFTRTLQKYRSVDHRAFEVDTPLKTLDQYAFDENEQIIVSIHLPSRSGMIEMQGEAAEKRPPAYVPFITKHAKNITLALFGNPYNLQHFENVPTIAVGYENEPEAQEALAHVLLGLREARGTLPVTPPLIN